jgi:hypothetical protein
MRDMRGNLHSYPFHDERRRPRIEREGSAYRNRGDHAVAVGEYDMQRKSYR